MEGNRPFHRAEFCLKNGMPKQSYMPKIVEGTGVMLLAFDTPGIAEIWAFGVQCRYQNQPFGQVSQPLNLTVRG
jgi:hypothetical protein